MYVSIWLCITYINQDLNLMYLLFENLWMNVQIRGKHVSLHLHALHFSSKSHSWIGEFNLKAVILRHILCIIRAIVEGFRCAWTFKNSLFIWIHYYLKIIWRRVCCEQFFAPSIVLLFLCVFYTTKSRLQLRK